MPRNPIDSVDLEDLLHDAIVKLAQAKENSEDSRRRNAENVNLLESVVRQLEHFKERRRGDSDIIK